MPLQVVYSSASTTPLQLDALEDLLDQAQQHNERAGITGALAYVDGCFLQVLEGEPAAVQALMARIASDLRHDTVTVLMTADTPAAMFTGWRMAYVSATAAEVAQWAGLGPRADLPETLAALRNDRARVQQLTRGIVAVLMGSGAAGGGGA
jgi:hypothetical protein